MNYSKALEGFIAMLLVAIVGLALTPTIISSSLAVAANSTYVANTHLGTVVSLVYLIPIIFVIILIVAVVGFIKEFQSGRAE